MRRYWISTSFAERGVAVDAHALLEQQHHPVVRLGRARARRCTTPSATISASRRSNSARVAEWRIRSISSLIVDSFSMYVSDCGTYASGW